MDPEVLAIASTAAAKLVGLMMTDGWAFAKDRFAHILARDAGREQEHTMLQLEASARELDEVDPSDMDTTRAEVIAEWQGRIRRLLLARPDLAIELRNLLQELKMAEPDYARHDIYLSANAKGHGRVYQQGEGTQYNIENRT